MGEVELVDLSQSLSFHACLMGPKEELSAVKVRKHIKLHVGVLIIHLATPASLVYRVVYPGIQG